MTDGDSEEKRLKKVSAELIEQSWRLITTIDNLLSCAKAVKNHSKHLATRSAILCRAFEAV